MAPSPTALAIRFTESWRTSPAANSPGRLDSSRNGSRSRFQPGSAATLGPGQDEAALVAGDDAVEPGRPRLLADEDEHRVERELDVAVRRREGRALEVRRPAQRARPRCCVWTSTFSSSPICSTR